MQRDDRRSDHPRELDEIEVRRSAADFVLQGELSGPEGEDEQSGHMEGGVRELARRDPEAEEPKHQLTERKARRDHPRDLPLLS